MKRKLERAREGVENWFRVRMKEGMFLAKEVWVKEGEEWERCFMLWVKKKKREMGGI